FRLINSILLRGRDMSKSTLRLSWTETASKQDISKARQFLLSLPKLDRFTVKWTGIMPLEASGATRRRLGEPLSRLGNDETLLHLAAHTRVLTGLRGDYTVRCLRDVFMMVLNSKFEDEKCVVIYAPADAVRALESRHEKRHDFDRHPKYGYIHRATSTTMAVSDDPVAYVGAVTNEPATPYVRVTMCKVDFLTNCLIGDRFLDAWNP
ncbi:hypothetical protein PFISCL1PPCAC_8895, partial [Pristionchus fissidentatus]